MKLKDKKIKLIKKMGPKRGHIICFALVKLNCEKWRSFLLKTVLLKRENTSQIRIKK